MAQDKVDGYRLYVVGGSAGSLETILKIVAALPEGFRANMLVVVHRKNEGPSLLASLLVARTALPVREVEDKEPLVPGTIYVAPPDYHLLLEDHGHFSLDISEKVHFSRPSIDVSFESAASVYGAAVVGVLLSGANADGAAGLRMIKAAGGLTIVQDPASAEIAFMPQQALHTLSADFVLPPDAIAEKIKALATE